jgi:hypothetical protein
MAFLAELVFQLLLYTVGWAVGTAILYVCSWGRIVPKKANVNGTYERLPNGEIVVDPELVCYFGVLMTVLAGAVWLSLFH